MATYTVNISGTFNATYAYLTINGTKITAAGTKTYSSKPTIKVYLSSYYSPIRPLCNVKINGTVVQEGEGEYTLSTEATTIDIVISQIQDTSTYLYFTADISFDPMSPHDGHNTNIGQVARQIEAGTALFNGVSREIESGLTLAGGVAREIVFGPDEFIVSISGSGNSSNAYITIGNTKYYRAAQITVPAGTTISMYCQGMYGNGTITLNGTTMSRGYPAKYTHTVTTNLSIKLTYETVDGKIEITTS